MLIFQRFRLFHFSKFWLPKALFWLPKLFLVTFWLPGKKAARHSGKHHLPAFFEYFFNFFRVTSRIVVQIIYLFSMTENAGSIRSVTAHIPDITGQVPPESMRSAQDFFSVLISHSDFLLRRNPPIQIIYRTKRNNSALIPSREKPVTMNAKPLMNFPNLIQNRLNAGSHGHSTRLIGLDRGDIVPCRLPLFRISASDLFRWISPFSISDHLSAGISPRRRPRSSWSC